MIRDVIRGSYNVLVCRFGRKDNHLTVCGQRLVGTSVLSNVNQYSRSCFWDLSDQKCKRGKERVTL